MIHPQQRHHRHHHATAASPASSDIVIISSFTPSRRDKNPLQPSRSSSSSSSSSSPSRRIILYAVLLGAAMGMTLSISLHSMMIMFPNTTIHMDITMGEANSRSTALNESVAAASSHLLVSSSISAPTSTIHGNNHNDDHDGSIESLLELTQSLHENKQTCPKPQVLVRDSLLSDPALAYVGGRKIPRIVHVSSASRCNHKMLAKSLNTWRLEDHYFLLHDDAAVLRLLHDYDWSREFPLLSQIMKCFPQGMGAAWIDLWRLLVLWKFGGIYADFDTSPVPSMFNATTITDDDAFFVEEVQGSPSQWFMAASPKHPMMYLSIVHLIINVLRERHLGNFQVVFTTGPGAVAEGFASFMNTDKYLWNAPAGHYVGMANRSVTIVGSRKNENMYITRVIKHLKSNKAKQRIYAQTNMTHLTKAQGTIYQPNEGADESCMSRLYAMTTSTTSTTTTVGKAR